jgi:hypothetical protein
LLVVIGAVTAVFASGDVDRLQVRQVRPYAPEVMRAQFLAGDATGGNTLDDGTMLNWERTQPIAPKADSLGGAAQLSGHS